MGESAGEKLENIDKYYENIPFRAFNCIEIQQNVKTDDPQCRKIRV
jgi:hypothetical protein